MIEYMKKYLSLTAALLLTAACNPFKTGVYQDNLAMPLAEGSPDSLLFSVSLEFVRADRQPEAATLINNVIIAQAFDLEDGPSATLEETAVRYRENLIDEYLNENEAQEMENMPLTWEDHITGQFTGTYKNWRNYLFTYFSDRGGAHGLQTVSNLVFDKKTGAVVTEADLFTDGYASAVATLLQEAAKSSFAEEDEELLQLVDFPAIVPNGNFSVGPDGVEWTFQPYEAGPYALGILTATASWEQLKPYLRQ